MWGQRRRFWIFDGRDADDLRIKRRETQVLQQDPPGLIIGTNGDDDRDFAGTWIPIPIDALIRLRVARLHENPPNKNQRVVILDTGKR